MASSASETNAASSLPMVIGALSLLAPNSPKKQAMYEARIFIAMQHLRKDLYDARDIINLKITFSL